MEQSSYLNMWKYAKTGMEITQVHKEAIEENSSLKEVALNLLKVQIVEMSELIKNEHNVHEIITNILKAIRVMCNNSREDTEADANTVTQPRQVVFNRILIDERRSSRVGKKEEELSVN